MPSHPTWASGVNPSQHVLWARASAASAFISCGSSVPWASCHGDCETWNWRSLGGGCEATCFLAHCVRYEHVCFYDPQKREGVLSCLKSATNMPVLLPCHQDIGSLDFKCCIVAVLHILAVTALLTDNCRAST